MKIAQVTQNGTWESQYGLLYRMEIILEDNRAGEVLAKKPDQWKAGDEVEIIEAKPNAMGLTKWKLQRPQAGQPGGRPDDIQRRIDASWAVGQAVQCILIMGERPNDLDEEIEAYALRLLKIRNKLI